MARRVAAVPKVQIPSFALVMRLRHPQEFGEVLEEAFQKAIGLVTVTSGQRGVSGMIIDRPTYHDVHYTVAYFAAPVAAGPRPRRRPLQLPSRAGQVGRLHGAELHRGPGPRSDRRPEARGGGARAPVAGVHSLVELDMAELIALADANRKLLVRQNMAKYGIGEEAAAARYDAVTAVIKRLGQATLKIGVQGGQVQAGLQFKLNLK